MQPELQDHLSEITIAIEKVNVMISDIFSYLSDKPEFLKYYQRENYMRSSIALDYVSQALREMEKLEEKVKKEREEDCK